MMPTVAAIRRLFTRPSLSFNHPDNKVPKKPAAKNTPLTAPMIVVV